MLGGDYSLKAKMESERKLINEKKLVKEKKRYNRRIFQYKC
jgi:hypothetical protein